jgi:hypothetical protein
VSAVRKGAFDHVADPPPAIVDYIKQRNFERLDAIVAKWERDESLKQLRRDLGVIGGPGHARRKQATVKVETTISLAVMTAALNGNADPFAAAETATGYDAKRIQRAWSNWRALQLNSLEAIANSNHPQFADAARAAIIILERQDTK